MSTEIIEIASNNNTYYKKIYFKLLLFSFIKYLIIKVNLVSQPSTLILVTLSTWHTQKEYLTSRTVFKSIATGGCTEYLDVSVWKK